MEKFVVVRCKPKTGPKDVNTIPCGSCEDRMDLKKGRWVCRKCGLSCPR